MTFGEAIKVEFLVNKPVYPGGPIVSWAIVISQPNGDNFVIPARD